MGCGVKWQQIGELDKALGRLSFRGMGVGNPAYDQLNKIRGRVFKQVGFKYPREVTLLLKLIGLSPGVVSVWFDIEAGWMSEARTKPGAPPVYKSIPADTGIDILQGKLTHELEASLMTPDDYYGE